MVGEIGRYLSSVDEADRETLARVYGIARRVVPEAVEGTSYSMAALLYRGRGLVATVQARKFLSLYPYSGSVIANLADSLSAFETTKGSIHYSTQHQLPEALVRRIVEARREEIDSEATP